MRIAVADDNESFGLALGRLLSLLGHELVGRYGDADGLVRGVMVERPEAVLVDVCMPPTYTYEGIGAAIELRATRRVAAVLVVSSQLSVRHAQPLICSGLPGLGCLDKASATDPSLLQQGLGVLAAGGVVVDGALVQALIQGSPRRNTLEHLDPPEIAVLEAALQGVPQAHLADVAGLDPGAIHAAINAIRELAGLDLTGLCDDPWAAARWVLGDLDPIASLSLRS